MESAGVPPRHDFTTWHTLCCENRDKISRDELNDLRAEVEIRSDGIIPSCKSPTSVGLSGPSTYFKQPGWAAGICSRKAISHPYGSCYRKVADDIRFPNMKDDIPVALVKDRVCASI